MEIVPRRDISTVAVPNNITNAGKTNSFANSPEHFLRYFQDLHINGNVTSPNREVNQTRHPPV